MKRQFSLFVWRALQQHGTFQTLHYGSAQRHHRHHYVSAYFDRCAARDATFSLLASHDLNMDHLERLRASCGVGNLRTGRRAVDLDRFKAEIISLYTQNNSTNNISTILKDTHGVSVGAKTVHRRLQDWGVRLRKVRGAADKEEIQRRVNTLIRDDKLRTRDVLRILEEEGTPISERTLRNVRKQLGIVLRVDKPRPKHQLIRAPSDKDPRFAKSVFLAGATTQVDGHNWRELVRTALFEVPLTIYDPYRKDWDSSWREDIDFTPYREQVEWELDKQDKADIVVLYFDPATQAPISLLELGLCARVPGKAIVLCPEGYWKRGNVQIVCRKYGVETVNSVDELKEAIVKRLPADPIPPRQSVQSAVLDTTATSTEARTAPNSTD